MFLTGMPYTNYQNLNLDWVMKEVKKIPETIEQSISSALQNVVFNAMYDADTETIILSASTAREV